MTLALPPLGWIVVISWIVLMVAAIATADAVQNPGIHSQLRHERSTGVETPGYQVIEASIDHGVRLRTSTAPPRNPRRNRRLQTAVSA
jgi:hypothetical protein